MSVAERQAARRKRQNEAEALLAQLTDDIRAILANTENLYATMYSPLSPAGREIRIDQEWGRLLKSVHAAAYRALPNLTPEMLELIFPMSGNRRYPWHDLRPTELRLRDRRPLKQARD